MWARGRGARCGLRAAERLADERPASVGRKARDIGGSPSSARPCPWGGQRSMFRRAAQVVFGSILWAGLRDARRARSQGGCAAGSDAARDARGPRTEGIDSHPALSARAPSGVRAGSRDAVGSWLAELPSSIGWRWRSSDRRRRMVETGSDASPGSERLRFELRVPCSSDLRSLSGATYLGLVEREAVRAPAGGCRCPGVRGPFGAFEAWNPGPAGPGPEPWCCSFFGTRIR